MNLMRWEEKEIHLKLDMNGELECILKAGLDHKTQ